MLGYRHQFIADYVSGRAQHSVGGVFLSVCYPDTLALWFILTRSSSSMKVIVVGKTVKVTLATKHIG